MSYKTHSENYADEPNTAEVLKKMNENSNKERVFVEEKTLITTEIALAQQKKEMELSTVEEDTHNKLDDLAESSDTEYQNILKKLPNKLQDIQNQLRFTARKWKTREIRQIARWYRKEFIKDMKYTCETLGIYFNKLKKWDFDENMITPEQIAILEAKTKAWHDKIKGFIGDTLTGDNQSAERGNKKDIFVWPNIKTSTDGIEVRWTCTPAEANAMANACSQPQTAEWKKKYYGMIDKNINIPVFWNTGNQVVKTWLKILPDIIRGWLAIKYWRETIKGIFWLFSKEWRTSDKLIELTKNLAIAWWVLFTDIDKASAYVWSWFSNASKDYSGNGTSSIWSNKDIIEWLWNLKEGESLPFGYGETLMGKAFASSWWLTIGEINQEQIITYSGNRPVDINFSRLKKMYSEKMNWNDADIAKYTQAISDVNDLETAYNTLKTDNQKREFMDSMTKVWISKEVLDNPALQEKPLALFMASAMQTAETLPKLAQRLILSGKIFLNKDVEAYVSTYGKELFMDDIMKLPDTIRLWIENKEITFSVENWKLTMNAYGEKAWLDLTTKKLSLYNKSGELKEFTNNGATDIAELITVANYSLQAIKEHKGKFMIDNPMFFSKPYGDWWHKICATLWWREWLKPWTRVSGRSVTILDGSYRFGDNWLSKFKEDNVMTQYADFLNSLWIWKWDNADNFIQNNLKKQIELQYPTMNPSEREQLLQASLGIITNRWSLEPLVYNTKEKVTGKIGDIYTDITTILWDGWERLRNAGNKIIWRSVVWGVLTLTLAGNAVKTIRDFLWDLYPESVVNYIKNKYSQWSGKSRWIIGTASNAVTNFLLWITLFGENKIQKTEENNKQQVDPKKQTNQKKNVDNTTSKKEDNKTTEPKEDWNNNWEEDWWFDPLKTFKKNVKTWQESVK
jgi:hypothetical protein